MSLNVRSPVDQAAFEASPQGRYIAAMKIALQTSTETAEIARAAVDLAERDWGGTNNRVLAGLGDSVGQSSLTTSRAGVTAWAIASANDA